MPTEPILVDDALKSKHQRITMEEELSALKKNNTLSLVPFTFSMNIVGSK